VKFLLSKGANPNITDNSGDTALLSVGFISDSIDDDIEIVRLLIKAGADIDFQDSNGSTALHSAVMFERSYLVKALLDNGANTEIRDKYNETPILSLCVISKEEKAKEIFNLLLLKGTNINILDKDGDSLSSYNDCLKKPNLMKYMKSKGLK